MFETRFPLRVENCELVADSGGAGQWRGGLGYRRTLLMTQVPITGSQCSDRHEVKPWALFGGEPGGNGGTLIQKAGSDEWQTVKELYGKVSTSKYANVTLRSGRPRALMDPGRRRLWRPAQARPGSRRRGHREGYVSEAAANAFYRTPLAAE